MSQWRKVHKSLRMHRASPRVAPHVRATLSAILATVAVASTLLGVWLLSSALAVRRIANAFSGVVPEGYIVRPGDSLWSIARAHAVAGCETQEVVGWIFEHNDLPNALLQPGERLLVPSTVASVRPAIPRKARQSGI